MTSSLQTQLDKILAICQKVRETHAKMTPGPWRVIGEHQTEVVALEDTPDAIVVIDTRFFKEATNPNEKEDATGIALQHNVSLALAETMEIAIKTLQKQEESFGDAYTDETEMYHCQAATDVLQHIADIWKERGLI